MFGNFGQLASKQDLQASLDTLCTSTGYRKLNSSNQQKSMRGALITQHRLDRHLKFGDPSHNYRYARSQQFLTDINCHLSAYCVDNDIRLHSFPGSIPKPFFQSNYNILPFSIHLQARHFILRKDFPSIVQIANDGLGQDVLHSCIAIDETPDGTDILIWEKQGYYYPFRVTTLKTVFDWYTCDGHESFWAVRPLQTPH